MKTIPCDHNHTPEELQPEERNTLNYCRPCGGWFRPALPRRPYMFAARHPHNNALILIRTGDAGYWTAEGTELQHHAERMIATQGEAITDSALAGSMFGWHLPAAGAALAYAKDHETTQEPRT